MSRAERGHLDTLALRAIRRMFAIVEALAEIDVRWRGGEADRLLDERHARLVAEVASRLRRWGWTVFIEVTYSIFGERGSIDLLAVHEKTRCAAVAEVKSEIASAEETMRRFDAKCRLARRLVRERVGWEPRSVGRFLVVGATKTNRRRVAGLADVFADAYPARTVEVSRWLREPEGDVGGIWFVSISHGRTDSPGAGGPKRIRRPRVPSSGRAASVDVPADRWRPRTGRAPEPPDAD